MLAARPAGRPHTRRSPVLAPFHALASRALNETQHGPRPYEPPPLLIIPRWRDFAATVNPPLHVLLDVRSLSGGEMLFKVALLLLFAWLLGVLGAHRVGDFVHVLLLVGLMLLLLAFLKTRDAAARRVIEGPPPDKR